MKLKLLLTIFFLIATSLSAMHEIEHIKHNEVNSECSVYHINDNLTFHDVIDVPKYVEVFHFNEIVQNNQILQVHVKDKSNQDRAPPQYS